ALRLVPAEGFSQRAALSPPGIYIIRFPRPPLHRGLVLWPTACTSPVSIATTSSVKDSCLCTVLRSTGSVSSVDLRVNRCGSGLLLLFGEGAAVRPRLCWKPPPVVIPTPLSSLSTQCP
ncbi:unnamed protein product, partial [Ectocarpus fasciculatus]